jgi:hypothetical protein
MDFKEFCNEYKNELRNINVNIEEEDLKLFYEYMKKAIEWNEKINITAITDEKMFIATLNNDASVLQNVMKRVELCFADTLEGVTINARVFYISNKDLHLNNPYIIRFASVNDLRK